MSASTNSTEPLEITSSSTPGAATVAEISVSVAPESTCTAVSAIVVVEADSTGGRSATVVVVSFAAFALDPQ